MNTLISPLEPTLDPLAFDAALNDAQRQSIEQASVDFGVNRRVVITLATKSHEEMAEALGRLADDDGFFSIFDMISDYRDHLDRMADLTKAVEVRTLIACHDALGMSLDETEPAQAG